MEQDCFGGGLQIVLSNKAVGETKTTNLGNYRAAARVNYCGILQLTSWRIFIETWHRASCCYLLLLFQQIIVQLTPDGDITYTIFKIYLTVFLFQGVTDEEPICISFR